ncbi:MAG: cupin domain-containing protein [Nostoc sp.]|uniref:cupin domain-containing carboxymuconolactone decarboxylase family protein n=1 Tax=Nostoc sp. TaxID=1180 RepID=UPI002FF21388
MSLQRTRTYGQGKRNKSNPLPSFTFEAGARSAWHTHPAGQHLVVTAGAGRTAEWGGKVQEIKTGDVIWCPPGVKHWHGASPTTAVTHLAITDTVNNKNVEWMEKVTDAQYNAEAGTMNTTHALSAKQRSIIPIAAFTASGDQQKLKTALTEGLEADLTVNETKEILVQMYAYAGFPRSLIPILYEVALNKAEMM